MYLKNYQTGVVNELRYFFKTARATKDAILKASESLPQELKGTLNWVDTTFNACDKPLVDKPVSGLGEFYPRFCIKVPTGGGKTLLAVETIREYQTLFAQRKTGLVVWMVPSEVIYTQTVKKLRDRNDFYRQLLDQSSGGHTLIIEKGQKLTKKDVAENLVILFLMIQSVNRKNGKETLKVFEDSGGYDSFFPEDGRYDLHKQLIEKIPNLDVFSGLDSFHPQVKTSLGNLIRLTNPLIIADEFHKVFSDTAKDALSNLNPSNVVGFSATPKESMNILVNVSGLQLKEEEMIKLDLHLKPPVSFQDKDWRAMLQEIKQHRENLEKKAVEYQRKTGKYIRPIALIQVERTGKDQRGHGFVHSLDVKEFLVKLEVPEHQVAIKTSSQNDIEDIDLLSSNCEIRYIITKEALKEGWDCPFSYVLGIIPNVSSNTGTTQLVGRILRQPYVKKTGVKELDESYVYFVSGQTQLILDQIKEGFKNDGLGDLIGAIQTNNSTQSTTIKTVKIKREYTNQYGYSLFLPIWLMKNGNSIRAYNYEIDIKSQIDYSENHIISKDWTLNDLTSALSRQKNERKGSIVTIDDKSKTIVAYEQEEVTLKDSIDLNYFTRRLDEYCENAFAARKQAEHLLNEVLKNLSKELLSEHFGFVVGQMLSLFQKRKAKQEKAIFQKYIKEKKLILAVLNDKNIGFTIPKEDTIFIDHVGNPYSHYLYDDIELKSLNPLEKNVADNIERQEKVLWWFRNKTQRNWYAIQGWQKQKIRPDFVAAKKNGGSRIELVYVLESKGKQLIGNEDTTYKNDVFKLMNEMKIEVLNENNLLKDEMNDKIKFNILNESNEQKDINTLFS